MSSKLVDVPINDDENVTISFSSDQHASTQNFDPIWNNQQHRMSMPNTPSTPLSNSDAFISFNASFPLRRIKLQTPKLNPPVWREWEFYQSEMEGGHEPSGKGSNQQPQDANEKNPSVTKQDVSHHRRPLIIISDLYSTLSTFYQTILSLNAKNLPKAISHIYALSVPAVDSIEEYVVQFATFCEQMNVSRAHLLCMGPLGCLLGQSICDSRPDLGASLMLINASGVTNTNSIWVQRNVMPELAINVAPAFILRKLVRGWGAIDRKLGLNLDSVDEAPEGMEQEEAVKWQQRRHKTKMALKKHYQLLSQSLQFVKHQLQQTSRKELAARINMLTRSVFEVERLFLDDEFITIVETLDQTMASRQDRNELQECYPNARLAQIKYGGDFPQLANSEEVLLHVEVHLRRTERMYEEREEEIERDSRRDDSSFLKEQFQGHSDEDDNGVKHVLDEQETPEEITSTEEE
mmetsp:Transcript_7850/g.29397  ORF Transcript_7850/g.29397 Transcript_7850/m.29397 type:complete len:464 (-) Transcript_7850:1794-3185(-)|eukprot:CAMPEP_0117442278 /NCGR_PEP_ID=MMETSP0759-20121206/4068_1 /TAXON_ID=63605 /ORGANISM="Percolomonas cosmopolitus, Strain WS" /LENGTH=463 /DNA_ID=CAMNT_0005234159 /DNA_START=87 /DNA_END=1478 /DNA_ORIENTATION=-